MRTHEDRYQKDQEKLDLAINMIQLNARTCVIRQWTGLSDDRIRKLVKFYGATGKAKPLRHRGRSPTLSPLKSSNLDTRQQAHLLSGIFVASGLMNDPHRSASPYRRLHFGKEFCQAYWWFIKIEGAPSISFEHALVLWQQIAQRTDVALKRCPRCQALSITRRYGYAKAYCDHCSALLAPIKLDG